MPHRIIALAFVAFASHLVVAIELGTPARASAGGKCLERYGSDRDQAGQWYYRVDRAHHRRCWYFETTKVKEAPTTLPNEQSSQSPDLNGSSEQSWLSRLVAGLKQKLSIGTQEAGPPNDATTATNIPVPNPPKKIARAFKNPPKKSAGAFKHRSHFASRPEIHDDDAPQLSPAVRDRLFQEFLRRYGTGNIPSSPPP
jgi:hypothetical protein